MPYFAPYAFQEYPKWLRRAGHPDVLVADADAEAAQIAAWGDDAPERAPVNRLVGDSASEQVEEAKIPKRRGGWPKGKKRGNSVAVN